MLVEPRTSSRPPRPRASLSAGPAGVTTSPAVRFVCGVMEVLVLGGVVLTPWAFGAAEPVYEFWLNLLVAVLLALWGVRALLERRFTWRKCPVTLCLAGLFLLGVVQLAPLPQPILRTLAPATAALYESLLPATPEVLPDDEPRLPPAPPAGSTLSVYPAATRQALLRLLAVFALFAVVRNNLTSAAALRRLCLVATLNGALLALLGLLQFFTSPHHLLYWTIPSPGQVFGPFVCRTHFAFYANLCLGLGVGLLPSFAAGERARMPRLTTSLWERFLDRVRAPLTLLQEPRVLWVSVALALMVCGVFFSLSRGGILALLAAGLIAGMVALWKRPRALSLGGVFLGLGLAAGLALWFGLGAVQGRLATLWTGTALQESRLALWASTEPLIREFPVWGTGYGTFQYAEPMHRAANRSAAVVYDHAHNEYLEALVEGGVPRLLVSLLAVALVFCLGCKAVRRHQGRSAGGLALGGLLAFLTMVLHSFGDFGLHLPAVAFLAAVLCAQLCGLGDARTDAPEYVFRLGGLAPFLGAATLVLVGLVLAGESRRAEQVERWRFTAYRLGGRTDADGRRQQIACLEQAARLAPESAAIQAELGQVHLNAWQQELDRRHQRDRVCEAALLVGAGPPLGGGAHLSSLTARLAAVEGLDEASRGEEERLFRTHLIPALRHTLLARDLCPLLDQPHLRLADFRDGLRQADPQTAYLERAKRVRGSHAESSYLSGLQEFLAGSAAQEGQ